MTLFTEYKVHMPAELIPDGATITKAKGEKRYVILNSKDPEAIKLLNGRFRWLIPYFSPSFNVFAFKATRIMFSIPTPTNKAAAEYLYKEKDYSKPYCWVIDSEEEQEKLRKVLKDNIKFKQGICHSINGGDV